MAVSATWAEAQRQAGLALRIETWPLWVPRYRESSPGVHSGSHGSEAIGRLPGPYLGRDWYMHQYPSQGRVAGIKGDVDLNFLRG